MAAFLLVLTALVVGGPSPAEPARAGLVGPTQVRRHRSDVAPKPERPEHKRTCACRILRRVDPEGPSPDTPAPLMHRLSADPFGRPGAHAIGEAAEDPVRPLPADVDVRRPTRAPPLV